MARKFIGHLPDHDPLRGYLQYDIQPQISGASDRVKYRVYKMLASNDVYLYEDKFSGARVVGKFFQTAKEQNIEKAAHRLTSEFHNLCTMRDYGLTTSPHYVVRPLGRNYGLNALLVVEYCDGELLSEIIQMAIYQGDHDRLYRKLTALAYFPARFHNRTAIDACVNFNEDCAYMNRLINMLLVMNAISWDEAREFYGLRDQWRHKSGMWEDRQVMVHGDATPENFLFGGGLHVIAFDLERAFCAITNRVPFYSGITLLRISRNGWINPEYRRELISEAKNTLRGA